MFISTWLELFLLQLSEPIKLVIRFCNCCCNYSLGTSKGIIKYGDSKDYFFPSKSNLLNFFWPGVDFSCYSIVFMNDTAGAGEGGGRGGGAGVLWQKRDLFEHLL